MIHFLPGAKKTFVADFSLSKNWIICWRHFFRFSFGRSQKSWKSFFLILGKKWIKKFHQKIVFIFWFMKKVEKVFFGSQQKINTNFWHQKIFCKIFDSFFTGTEKKNFFNFFRQCKKWIHNFHDILVFTFHRFLSKSIPGFFLYSRWKRLELDFADPPTFRSKSS